MDNPTLYRVNVVATVDCWVNAHGYTPEEAQKRVEGVLHKRLTNFLAGAAITVDDLQTVEVRDARS